jgi:hypothetical protein
MKISRVEKSLGTAMRAAPESLTLEELGRTAVPHLARALNAPIYLPFRIVDPGRLCAIAAEPPESYAHFSAGQFRRDCDYGASPVRPPASTSCYS